MQQLTLKQKIAYGIGAVGKDMVYALSANYVLYYYKDIIGLSSSFVGLILMIARIFDAVNDPFMGILVAKTRTRWGRFRPWLFTGTVLNALVLYALYAAPHGLSEAGMMIFFTVIYILWGMTYTMMDIPYWSMIPAITNTPAETENLSVIGRTCAGVGAAIMAMGTMMAVEALGGGNERTGFQWLALIVAAVFVVTEVICCAFVREREDPGKMETTSVGQMFRALFRNDQALIVVLSIILINCALYLTSNLIIFFFKYDMGGMGWKGNYTIFSTVGGAMQIVGMMVVYPLLRKFKSNTIIFRVSLGLAMLGYLLILVLCMAGASGSLLLICLPGALVFTANGILSVLTTVFLSNSVDYGELKTGHREESVIFSMQTFVVKAASGFSVFAAGVGLDLIGLVGNSEETEIIEVQTPETLLGLRLLMTLIPIALLIAAYFIFLRRFKLSDETVAANSEELKARHLAETGE